MKYVLGMRVTVVAAVAALMVFAVTLIEYQQAHYKELTLKHALQNAQRELTMVRSNLEADIYSDIFYASSLATLISVSPDSSALQWEKISHDLYTRANHLRNLAIAPDDIIQFVYPPEGNEKALGLDFRTLPEQYETVHKARDTQSIFIAGPVDLVQGGIGLIARYPIFSDPPLNSVYWGTCSVVIDLEKLFQEAGIFLFPERYDFAIRGANGMGSQGAVFWGSADVFDASYASERVSLPSGSWEMGISLNSVYEELPWYEKYAARLIGYPVVVFLILLILVLYYLYHIAHQNSLQDDLTHLPNRRYIMYTLEQMVEDSRRKGSGFALLNLDLDKFKSVNDTHGHAAGDKLLITVARRIKKALRSSDIVARVGGDEFLIILPRIIDETDVQKIVANLEQEITEAPVQLGYGRVVVEVSIGFSIYTDFDITADELIRRSDVSMYNIKQKR